MTDALSRREMARITQNYALRTSTGYVSGGVAPADDERVETRLDEIDAIEVFLVDGADGYRPFGGRDWSDGRIRLPARRFVEGGLARAKQIATHAGLARGTLAVPMRQEGGHWVHDGEIMRPAVVDPRWGLRWRGGEPSGSR